MTAQPIRRRTAVTAVLIMALVMTLVMAIVPAPPSVADTPSDWAAEDIARAAELGLVPDSLNSGYNAPITRAEFCAIAVRVYENSAGRAIGQRRSFSDTDDINVEKIGGLGVVAGVGGNRFAPHDRLTREQAAVILARMAETAGLTLKTEGGAAAEAFADEAEISDWARQAAGLVQPAGIMQGVENNRFLPKDSCTREAGIVTMLRLYELFADFVPETQVEAYTLELEPGKAPLASGVPEAQGEDEAALLREYADLVIVLINAEREKAGLPALAATEPLCSAAAIRAEETADIFSHTRPDGQGALTILAEFDMSYMIAGENIAAGQRSPELAVKAWLDAPAHNAAIMNPSFKQTGVGVYMDSSGRLYWAQLFVG